MTNPWDVLPIDKSGGDPNPILLFAAVGMALTAWERLEEVRAWTFGQLVQSRQGGAERAFGTIQSPSGRSGMVLAAAETILFDAPNLLTELRTLMRDVDALAGRRNDIAHGVVMEFTSQKNDEAVINHGSYLVPAAYNTRKHEKVTYKDFHEVTAGKKYAYRAAQVEAYVSHFVEYRKIAGNLLARIQAHCQQKWPPDISALLPTRP